jgi:hypothetical protein
MWIIVRRPLEGNQHGRSRGPRSDSHPDRFAILGNFPLEKPESRALVDSWKQRPGMLGLRFTFNEPDQRTWLADGTVDWLWAAAERAGPPIALTS